MKSQVMAQLNLDHFSTVSIEKYGTSPSDPRSQQECTVHIRMFVQAPKKEAITEFRRAIFYNGMQGYCGLHLSMDWRTMEPRPYVKYFPALIRQSKIPLYVEFAGERKGFNVPARLDSTCGAIPPQRSYEPQNTFNSSSNAIRRPLGDLVFARSGDKGGNANVGFWVRDRSAWPWLQAFLTSAKLVELLGDDWAESYSVERCEFPNLWAVHFVVKGILQDGVSSSSVLDGFGKSFGEFLRARLVALPKELVNREDDRRARATSFSLSSRL
jgi:hypothetical protein